MSIPIFLYFVSGYLSGSEDYYTHSRTTEFGTTPYLDLRSQVGKGASIKYVPFRRREGVDLNLM